MLQFNKIKVGLLMSLALVSVPALADNIDQLKINTIKQLYQYHIKTDGMKDTLGRFADPSLKKVFQLEDNYSKRNPGDIGCVDWDPITESQDPDFAQLKKAKYSVLKSGRVRANLSYTQIDYALTCNNQSCKVNDVFHNGGSLKQHIKKYCR